MCVKRCDFFCSFCLSCDVISCMTCDDTLSCLRRYDYNLSLPYRWKKSREYDWSKRISPYLEVDSGKSWGRKIEENSWLRKLYDEATSTNSVNKKPMQINNNVNI